MWTTVRRITREILEEKELLQRIHLTAPHISKVASHQLCIHEPTSEHVYMQVKLFSPWFGRDEKKEETLQRFGKL